GGDALEIVRSSEASEDAEDAVSTVVGESFRAYGSHYSANPRLDPSDALAGYVEWAVSAYRTDPGNVVLAMRDGRPVGVATLTRSGSDLEIELAGLTPAAQGRGLYGRLLTAVGRVGVEEGLDRVIISTQVHNTRVQRAWIRAGMKPFAAVATVHAMRR
ncbi:MAG: GNAT family N-acetyltransferase, partial [Dermatophilaceae bacterium]